jgi:hypothetical protein
MSREKSKEASNSVAAKDEPSAITNVMANEPAQTISLEEATDCALTCIQEQSAETPIQGPDWSRIKKLEPESMRARRNEETERWSVLREMYRARVQMIHFYTSPEGGKLSMKEAIQLADKELNGPEFKRELQRIGAHNVDQVSWYSLHHIFINDPDCAEQIWQDIKEEAEKDFLGGHLVAQVFETTDWQRNPWKRAQFIAVREGFAEQFQPQGAIDCSMIDMLAVNYFLWIHWTEEHLRRATTEPRRESQDYREWAKKSDEVTSYSGGQRHTRSREKQWTDGHWDIPYQCVAESIEQAAQLADRFRRAYQSQLRSIRDWRRYNVPVTINNPQQVNIAADGGQQVNVQKKYKKRTKNKRQGAPVVPSSRRLRMAK